MPDRAARFRFDKFGDEELGLEVLVTDAVGIAAAGDALTLWIGEV